LRDEDAVGTVPARDLSSLGAVKSAEAEPRRPMIGSRVRVLNLDNGRNVVVTIVGRGPLIDVRVIDVSTEAAVALGFRRAAPGKAGGFEM
jgi:rare lipoprotein A